MPKVNVTHGLTLKIFRGTDSSGRENFDFWRPEFSITDIDTDGDLDQQIEISLAALDRVNDKLSEYVSKMTTQQLEYIKKELEGLSKGSRF